MTGHLSISRRQLIVGGLMVTFACSARSRAATSEATSPSAIGGFVRISREGGISLVMPSVEMGQGIYTAEAALLAEELDVRLDQIVAIAAPPDASLYAQPLFKAQMTGGSTSIRGFWTPLRQAGAAARSMLVAAAAQAWGVHPDECFAKEGTIVHSSTGRVLTYGEVAESAATLPIPEDPKLKSPGDFRIIGKSQRRIDTPTKVNGSAVYGIDVAVDGMKTIGRRNRCAEDPGRNRRPAHRRRGRSRRRTLLGRPRRRRSTECRLGSGSEGKADHCVDPGRGREGGR